MKIDVKHTAELTNFRLKLKGKTAVFIDWANVYGWRKSLKQEVDPQKLYKYLKSYKEVKYIPVSLDSSHFKNLAQEIKNSLTSMNRLGARDIEKILQLLSSKVLRRKCDFDMEISIDTHKSITDDFKTFLFLSGDGDFAPLYKFLINLHKQVIVIFAHGHMGKEIYQIKKGIFTKAIDMLGVNLFV
ncbi:NYN domain-containing protein [Candidatus Daviesbacteria bacterium]|nr:NYN domain-containing protein [Candidatus Daviesbacteria bacterium]